MKEVKSKIENLENFIEKKFDSLKEMLGNKINLSQENFDANLRNEAKSLNGKFENSSSQEENLNNSMEEI